MLSFFQTTTKQIPHLQHLILFLHLLLNLLHSIPFFSCLSITAYLMIWNLFKLQFLILLLFPFISLLISLLPNERFWIPFFGVEWDDSWRIWEKNRNWEEVGRKRGKGGKRKLGRLGQRKWDGSSVSNLESRDLIGVDSEVYLEVLVCTLLLNQGLPDPFP